MDKVLYDYALSFLGTPYRWGGATPLDGLDCSGLVVELLKSVGLITHSSDYSSQSLFNAFSKTWPQIPSPKFGAIAFFGRSLSQISHVSFCLDQYRMLEASGGSSKTTTKAQAVIDQAFVKIRPVQSRRDFLCTHMPSYPKT